MFSEAIAAEKAAEATHRDQQADIDRTLKVKWNRESSLTQAKLEALCQKYGEIDHALLSSKATSGIVLFKSVVGAVRIQAFYTLGQSLNVSIS